MTDPTEVKPEVPVKLCECLCGLPAPTAKRNYKNRYRIGESMRFIRGHGPHAKGSESSNAKLTENDVHNIRELLATGQTQKDIAAMFGVSPACIAMIRRRVNWKHLEEQSGRERIVQN